MIFYKKKNITLVVNNIGIYYSENDMFDKKITNKRRAQNNVIRFTLFFYYFLIFILKKVLFFYRISAPNVDLKCLNAHSCPTGSKLATASLKIWSLYPRLYASTAVCNTQISVHTPVK